MYNPEAHPLIHSLDKRFAALAQFLRLFEQNDSVEAWHSNVIGCIPVRAHIYYRHLKDSFRGSLELMAWSSRSLLELVVWASYASKSKENARRLFEDQLVDLRGLLDNMQAIVKTFNAEVDKNLAQMERDRTVLKGHFAQSALAGDEDYLNVGKEARKLGLAGMFYGLNGFYSKLTHPTALSLLLSPTPEQDEQLRTFMTSMAALSAKDVLDIMAEHYKSLGTDTSLIEDPNYTDSGTLRPQGFTESTQTFVRQ